MNLFGFFGMSPNPQWQGGDPTSQNPQWVSARKQRRAEHRARRKEKLASMTPEQRAAWKARRKERKAQRKAGGWGKGKRVTPPGSGLSGTRPGYLGGIFSNWNQTGD